MPPFVIVEVFVLDPSTWFVSMSSARPFPDGLEESMINVVKDLFADHMAVIERPATNHRVEFCDQFACGQVTAFFDTLSDLAEERFDALLRWRDEELRALTSLVFAYGLTKEVKALFDMRNHGFLR